MCFLTFDVLAESKDGSMQCGLTSPPHPTLLRTIKIGACLIALDLVCTCNQPAVTYTKCGDLEM